MVYISKKKKERISENKLVFSGPDLTLSPNVLVDINVTRRIAEI
jgi:hypothetical protein